MANKSNVFYSQLGEDVYIYQRFINQIRDDGIFVELGGMDGVRYSNSKFFEDTLKFNGILIEPTYLFNFMIKNRPKCKNYNYAINQEEKMIEFIGNDATAGILETMPQYMREVYHKNSSIYQVPGIPIKNLLTDIKYIDVMFIDVEGAEEIVLETMNWNIEVYLIVIEMHGIDKDKDQRCREILEREGFTFYSKLCINEIWINDKYSRKILLYNPDDKIKGNNLDDFGQFPFAEPSWRQEILNNLK